MLTSVNWNLKLVFHQNQNKTKSKSKQNQNRNKLDGKTVIEHKVAIIFIGNGDDAKIFLETNCRCWRNVETDKSVISRTVGHRWRFVSFRRRAWSKVSLTISILILINFIKNNNIFVWGPIWQSLFFPSYNVHL